MKWLHKRIKLGVYIYSELGLGMYIDDGLLHCEIIDVVSRVTNAIFFERMIDLRICDKPVYWSMEFYHVFTRIVLRMYHSNGNS